MRPLEGLRVVDLTRVLSGPYCTMQLGDLGAEVIKVEQPGKGDDTRAFAPPFQGDQAAYFLSVNRNKKSITLDMKSARGKEVLWRLIDKSDILVENFRPGAMDRLGFGYEAVSKRRPSMIYASISGFGDSGPQKDRPGYDVIVQGEAGIMDITGPRDGAPYKVGAAIGDLVSGLYATQGILAALHTRNAGGAGPARAHLHVRGGGVAAHLQRQHLLRHRQLARAGAATSTPPSCPTRPSRRRTAGSISASPTTICGSASARPPSAPISASDPRFAKASDRVRNREVLVPLVRDIVKAAHARRVAGAHGQGRRAERRHPHRGRGVRERSACRARDMVAEMAHASAGTVQAIKNPVHLSATPLEGYAAPPALGEHTREVLTGLLGYSASEVDALARDKVI